MIAVEAWGAGVCSSADAAPRVTINGGADASGRVYTWTVANDHSSPVVFVEFPHYHAVLFFAPPGWTTDSTYLINVGVEDRPGRCRASADSPAAGIVRGGSSEFRMQVSSAGTQRGRGTVRVRFVDGGEAEIADVELPVPVSRTDKFLPLIGLGVIVVAFGVRAAFRKRRRNSN